ncbi:ABC transporter permease [Streptomyces sp. NPDC006307]|uniref:ABC transporter permease n=1 Tax=Streptomyces sp. NPDC006307 TaxID=3156748 RepID=UPI0033B6CD92
MSSSLVSGPRRVVVRQHRRALWTAGGLVVLAVAVATGLRWWSHAVPHRIFNGQMSPLGILSLVMDGASTFLLLVPILIGAFVAGPMIARELESGTYKVAWTQSVAPSRWLTSKLMVAAVLAAAASAVLIAAFRFGWTPIRGSYNLSWPDRGVYEATGPVLAAYSLLGVAVAAVVGQLVRRTVPAMAVTGVVTGTVLLVLGSLRWDVWPSLTLSGPGTDKLTGMQALPRDAFLLESGYVTAHGRLPYDACWRATGGLDDCPASLGITGWYAEYHPASHFWPVQLAETGIVLALAALAAYAAFRVLRRHHA